MYKLKFNRAPRRRRLPMRFRSSIGRFVIGHRSPVVEEPEAVAPASPVAPVLANLFQAVGIQLEDYVAPIKYAAKRTRKSMSKKRKKGLQYKLQFWKGVNDKQRERKYTKQTRDTHETNSLQWDSHDVFAVLCQMVERSFQEVFSLEQKGSSKLAEIVAWVQRRYDDSPFNFEQCCVAAGYDAERMREMFFKRLDDVHGTAFPHFQVLKNGVVDAESGDPDALEWVLSDVDAPLSFVDCCTSLGFDPKKARNELLLPVVTHDVDELPGFEDVDMSPFLQNFARRA